MPRDPRSFSHLARRILRVDHPSLRDLNNTIDRRCAITASMRTPQFLEYENEINKGERGTGSVLNQACRRNGFYVASGLTSPSTGFQHPPFQASQPPLQTWRAPSSAAHALKRRVAQLETMFRQNGLEHDLEFSMPGLTTSPAPSWATYPG
ncbi:uncharacterized protein N7515_005909 [Penicillium bovifimosum]|uniref:Uncharacterized protein n=1 Tax=Penicillium bovifimosum TaxID=126998 RepID=A0A9W9GTM9_9EURO|nr:uncharacterized protein N7515_005909 [Penicillium bovifimosum]KAJ5129870.1 hypothetical protein N7515_005909 [Penicillium bovifimosum]